MFFLATPTLAVTLFDPLGGASIPELIGRVIKAALGLSGSVALLMFIYGGFRWLTSGGNSKSIDAGKQTITWAILGLIIIFASYLIVDLIIRAITSGTTT